MWGRDGGQGQAQLGPSPLWLQHLPGCAEPGTHPRCSGDCPIPEPGTPPPLPRGDTAAPEGPHTPGWARREGREGDPELPRPGDQEGQPVSPVEGHAMPGHPPSLVGKGHAAASSPGNSHSPKGETGGKPIPGPCRDTQGGPSARHKGAVCPGLSAGAGCCWGPPPSSEGPAGPRDKREGGRARTWLRRSPSLPRLCFAVVPGRRPRLTFLCLPGLPGPTKPKYSHSPGGHMRAGGRKGGC